MTPSLSAPNPSSIQGHKLQMIRSGSRSAYLPGIIARQVAEKAAQSAVPGHRWPLGRIQPGQPAPQNVAANDYGPAPENPGPVVA